MVETKSQQQQQGMQQTMQQPSMQTGSGGMGMKDQSMQQSGNSMMQPHQGNRYGSGMMDFWRDPFGMTNWPMWNQSMMSQNMLMNFPKADISETETEMRIKCDMPGMKKEDINIEVDDSGKYLTLSGESKQEKREEKENIYMMERSYGSFNRRFRLPKNCMPDKVRAKLQDGVLMVTVPKEMPQQQQKKRNINWE